MILSSPVNKKVESHCIIIGDMTKINKMRIGARIREARKRAGLSQGALGERFGLTQVMISNLELGKHPFDVETLERIADILEVSPSEFLPEWFPGDSAEQKQILDLYYKLPENLRATAMQVLRDMLAVWQQTRPNSITVNVNIGKEFPDTD